MRTNDRGHLLSRLLLLHLVEVITGLYVLLLCQMTLIPFDFVLPAAGAAHGALFAETHGDITTPNVVGNLVIFFPLGVLLHWSLVRRRVRPSVSWVAVVVAAALLSVTMEWVQAYSPSRVSSAVDWVCNIAGAAVGGWVSWVCVWLFPRLLGEALVSFRHKPRVAVVQAYVGLLVVCGAMPFTYAIDRHWLKYSVKSATFVPFAQSEAYAARGEEALQREDFHAYAMSEYLRQRLWACWAAELASFALLAWLLHGLLSNEYRFGSFSSFALVCWIGGGLAVGLSLLQWLNVLRGFHVTSILMRLAGLGLGLAVRGSWVWTKGYRNARVRPDRGRRFAAVACCGVLAYIVLAGLTPWLPAGERAHMTFGPPSTEWLPFYGYFDARFHIMSQDVVGKVAAYIILGALLVASWKRLQRRPLAKRCMLAAFVGVLVTVPIETIQLLLPIRVTSVTDLILAGCACALGVLAHERAVGYYRFAVSFDRRARVPSTATSRLGLTDELIATLAEPRADAPLEPSPGITQREQT